MSLLLPFKQSMLFSFSLCFTSFLLRDFNRECPFFFIVLVSDLVYKFDSCLLHAQTFKTSLLKHKGFSDIPIVNTCSGAYLSFWIYDFLQLWSLVISPTFPKAQPCFEKKKVLFIFYHAFQALYIRNVSSDTKSNGLQEADNSAIFKLFFNILKYFFKLLLSFELFSIKELVTTRILLLNSIPA